MKYAGINKDKIYISEDLEDSIYYIKENTCGDIYAILNFDYVEPFNRLMNSGDK